MTEGEKKKRESFWCWLALAALIGGVVGDRFSSQMVLVSASVIAAGGALLAAFSVSLPMVHAGYGVLLGIGNGLLFANTMGAMAKIFPYNRPLASGIQTAAGSLGSMLLPLVIPVIVQTLTVRGLLSFYAGLMLNTMISGFLLRLVELDSRRTLAKPLRQKEVCATHVDNGNKSKPCPSHSCENQKEDEIMNKDHSEETRDNDTENGITLKKFSIETNEHQSERGKNMHLEGIASLKSRNLDDKGIQYEDEMKHANTKEWLKSYKEILTLKFLGALLYHLFYVVGVYAYLMYIPAYAEEVGLTKTQISLLLTVAGAMDLLSRLFIGFVGNLSGVNIYLLISCNCAICGIITAILPQLIHISGHGLAVLMLGMVAVGLLAGGLLSLLGPIVVNAVGQARATSGLGLINVSFSIGIGVPPFIFGGLKESTGVYSSVPLLSGLSLVFAALCIQLGQRPPSPPCVRSSREAEETQSASKDVEGSAGPVGDQETKASRSPARVSSCSFSATKTSTL